MELTEEVIDSLVADNFGVDCFLFLGEGKDPESLLRLAAHVRSTGLAVALYSGRVSVEDEIFTAFDYVKVGPYIESFGPLNSKHTNQRLYKVIHNAEPYSLIDITARFWHRGIDPNVK